MRFRLQRGSKNRRYFGGGLWRRGDAQSSEALRDRGRSVRVRRGNRRERGRDFGRHEATSSARVAPGGATHTLARRELSVNHAAPSQTTPVSQGLIGRDTEHAYEDDDDGNQYQQREPVVEVVDRRSVNAE
jgi:hypothetical protein